MRSTTPLLSAGSAGPVATWVIAALALLAAVAALCTLLWVINQRPTPEQRMAEAEQNRRMVEDAVRSQLQQSKQRQLAADVDGWVEPVVELSRRERDAGLLGTAAPDGWELAGCVVNRTGAPVWDVVIDLVDAQTEHPLPFPALLRPRVEPGTAWDVTWFCGSAFSAYYQDATVDPGDPVQLPVPHSVVGIGASRPQLRLAFTDSAGRWVHTGATLAPTVPGVHLTPGMAPFSRALEDLDRLRAGSRACYRSLLSELSMALQDAARASLQPLSTAPVELGSVAQLLAGDHYIYRLHLEPGTGDGNGATAGALRTLAGGFHELALRLAHESNFAAVEATAGEELARAYQLVAKASSVLTALGAVRINAPILAAASAATEAVRR
jgi:hypothetical protein